MDTSFYFISFNKKKKNNFQQNSLPFLVSRRQRGGTRENKGELFGMMYLLGTIRRL